VPWQIGKRTSLVAAKINNGITVYIYGQFSNSGQALQAVQERTTQNIHEEKSRFILGKAGYGDSSGIAKGKNP